MGMMTKSGRCGEPNDCAPEELLGGVIPEVNGLPVCQYANRLVMAGLSQRPEVVTMCGGPEDGMRFPDLLRDPLIRLVMESVSPSRR
jgi:hypothetical protein